VNLFTAAERLAAIDRSNIRLDSSRCLHTFDRFSECQACIQACPVDALQPDKIPVLDEKACVRCLACLPVCPTGALQAEDALRSLLNCIPRLPAGGVELVCWRQSEPRPGSPDSRAILRVRGCLAGLGPSTLAALVAAEATPLRLRTDACAACPWFKLEEQILSQVQAAKLFLTAWGKAEAVTCTSTSTDDIAASIPVWDADNPPLSRRDLFRIGTRQGSLALARAMNAQGEITGQKTPPRERRRILEAAAHFPKERTPGEAVRLEDLQWASVSITADCFACGVCARACPTGAIEFERDEVEASFRLSFHSEACTACQACVHSCAPGAIRLQAAPAFEQVFASLEPVVLLEGGLKRCQRCNAWIAAQRTSSLCPVCEYRKKHPFGSSLPPGFEMSALPVKKDQSQ
jgi:ferredoxin